MNAPYKVGYAPDAIAVYRAELRFLRNELQRVTARIEELTRIVGSEK